ncbi:hypothetical protein [Paraburkholderia caribensis]|uniref:hypothetical protein n=1 Tax=Paraburkholderia caribensis TaxID=75105 RepID=UPI0034D19BA5
MYVEFVRRLMLNAEAPVFLIGDGHPVHRRQEEQAKAALRFCGKLANRFATLQHGYHARIFQRRFVGCTLHDLKP